MEFAEKKILMIDDDVEDREIFLGCVQRIDASIICLQPASAALALDLIVHDKFMPHYIFLDLNMPIMNGFEFLTALRKVDSLPTTNVIVYSTSRSTQDFDKAKQLGAAGFLVKDSSLKELQASLKLLLQFGGITERGGSKQLGYFEQES